MTKAEELLCKIVDTWSDPRGYIAIGRAIEEARVYVTTTMPKLTDKFVDPVDKKTDVCNVLREAYVAYLQTMTDDSLRNELDFKAKVGALTDTSMITDEMDRRGLK